MALKAGIVDPAEAAAAPFTTRMFFALFPSIMLPMFLAAIEGSIVSTALPAMAGALGDVERVPWVVVAYLLAATIAVGGFVGVPGMIYIIGASGLVASATELVIAFVMGLGGTINWAMHGMVDIRLTVIILAGSLLGVQLGAIGTTLVKESLIKFVMGTIMLIVAVSRALAVPKYLAELGLMDVDPGTVSLMDKASFLIMCAALLFGALIIMGSMYKARKANAAEEEREAPVHV